MNIYNIFQILANLFVFYEVRRSLINYFMFLLFVWIYLRLSPSHQSKKIFVSSVYPNQDTTSLPWVTKSFACRISSFFLKFPTFSIQCSSSFERKTIKFLFCTFIIMLEWWSSVISTSKSSLAVAMRRFWVKVNLFLIQHEKYNSSYYFRSFKQFCARCHVWILFSNVIQCWTEEVTLVEKIHHSNPTSAICIVVQLLLYLLLLHWLQ